MARTKNTQPSYTDVLKQIESLTAEAERLRREEVAGVIERIRDAISHYQLTAADLGLNVPRAAAEGTSTRRKPGRKKAGKAPAVVKYRDEQGRGWGGIGKRPQWLRDALNNGKTLQDFLVK